MTTPMRLASEAGHYVSVNGFPVNIGTPLHTPVIRELGDGSVMTKAMLAGEVVILKPGSRMEDIDFRSCVLIVHLSLGNPPALVRCTFDLNCRSIQIPPIE